MKINLDEVYVVDTFAADNTKKSLMSLIIVGQGEFPLSQEIHDRIYQLSKVSDLFFIFTETPKIDPDKFCSLYSGSAWIISSGNLVKTYLKAMSYTYEILSNGNYRGTLTAYDIRELPEINEEKLLRIVGSALVQPILKMERLGPDEMYDIYSLPEKTVLFEKRGIKGDKKYSSWKGTSKLIFFRPGVVSNGLLSFESKEGYIETFTWKDIRYFLASSIMYLGVGHTDSEVLDVEI